LALVFTHTALSQNGLAVLSMTAETSLVPRGLAAVPHQPKASMRQRSSDEAPVVKVVVSRNVPAVERRRVAFYV